MDSVFDGASCDSGSVSPRTPSSGAGGLHGAARRAREETPPVRTDEGKLTGCWTGVSVSDVGRVVDCGGSVKIIGDRCDRCPDGRLHLAEGAVRCNVCSQAVGPVTRFLDNGPSVQRAIRFLQAQLSLHEASRREGTLPAGGITKGRAYWATVEEAGERVRRVVWEGQKCPACSDGSLRYFVGPDEAEEALICGRGQMLCFGVSVKASEPGPDEESQRRWKNVPLAKPSDCG
jgi:hypothetical protein